MTNYTLAKDILVIEVPSDAHSFEKQTNPVEGGEHICFLRGIPDYDCCYTENIPDGNWQILSLHSEMTEEKAKLIMPKIFLHTLEKDVYHNYPDKEDYLTSAVESYQSLVKSIGLVTENPFAISGREPIEGDFTKNATDHQYALGIYVWRHKKWHEAQKQVKNYLVLIRDN